MIFGSVCSGIEAASVAWRPLGWRAAWFSEIEPFPSAVLAHHYPGTPNLGDMKGIARRVITGEVEAPDVLCGGTPCQAFSVAGLRESLNDDRGNLTLTFCELADAIDFARTRVGHPPAIVFWENVPGVLSTRDNAFGCFLAGLAGEDGALKPPGGKWTNAGYVSGPARTVAWRTLDAQYFGLAQRRRRVFVVASARDDFDPAQVLFEWDGVRRDFAPSREAGKDTSGSPARRAGGGGLGSDFGCDGGAVVIKGAAIGRKPEAGPQYGEVLNDGSCYTLNCTERHAVLASTGDVSHCLNAGGMGRQDYESKTMVVHTLRGEGFDASEAGTGRGTPLVPVPVPVQPYTLAIRGRGDSHDLEYRQDGTANALLTPNGGRGGIGVGAIAHAFDAKQSDVIQYGSKTGPIDTDSHSIGVLAEYYSHDYCGDRIYSAAAVSPCLNTAQQHNVRTGLTVRRLTPTECERLQGFPDGYTAIQWRGKPANECPDGPRYKALGNSWAVPVVRWIGARIQLHIGRQETTA